MRVQLAGVGKHFGAHVILDQVTITIGPKARIGLVGPNGVGKTTLLRIVAGVEAPDSGIGDACAATPDRGVPRAGAPRRARSLGARNPYPAGRDRGRGAGAGGVGPSSRGRTARRRRVLGCARPPRRARCGELRGASPRDMRGARARRRPRPRARRALGRRGGPGRTRVDPALPLRRPAPRRADERPRLRGTRATRAVSRGVSRRARRRVARSRVPRQNGRSHRVDRAGHAARSGVGRRLERLRGGARHRARRSSRRVRAGAAPAQAAHDAPEHPADGGALEGRVARRQDRWTGSTRHACARDEGATGRAAPRAQRASGQALPAVGAEAHAPDWRSSVRPRAPAVRRRRRVAGHFVSARSTSISLLANGCRSSGRTAPASRRFWECSSARCLSPKASASSAGAR